MAVGAWVMAMVADLHCHTFIHTTLNFNLLLYGFKLPLNVLQLLIKRVLHLCNHTNEQLIQIFLVVCNGSSDALVNAGLACIKLPMFA